MEQLIQKIVAETGITNEQAKKAIELVSVELKTKFPSILHSEIDNVIAGEKFGNTYREKAENVFSDIRDRMNELFHTNKNSGNGK